MMAVFWYYQTILYSCWRKVILNGSTRSGSHITLFFSFVFQTAILLLRIDDIVSGHKKKKDGDEQMGGPGAE